MSSYEQKRDLDRDSGADESERELRDAAQRIVNTAYERGYRAALEDACHEAGRVEWLDWLSDTLGGPDVLAQRLEHVIAYVTGGKFDSWFSEGA